MLVSVPEYVHHVELGSFEQGILIPVLSHEERLHNLGDGFVNVHAAALITKHHAKSANRIGIGG